MALDFPASPANGQIYFDSTSGSEYIFNTSYSAWIYSSGVTPVSSNQVIYVNQGIYTGSNGITFISSSNTVYANTINVSQNVSSFYYFGNGAFLTGVVSDFSPAFNKANAALANTSGVYFAGNLYFPAGNVAIGNTTSIQKLEVVGNMAVSNFYENDINVASNVTITTGRNAMSAGPVTINSGITVTVPSGSTWTIV